MPNTDGGGPAQVLLLGGTVRTMEDATPRASAVAVRGERILAVGDEDALEVFRGPGTRVVELEGRCVVPGFVDAHVHFGSFALSRREVDLEQATTIQEGLERLRAAAAALPPGAWLRGRGWDRNRWGRLPTAAELDEAVGPRPALLDSHDGHAVWASSTALAAAGVGADTSDPPGGRVDRLADGHPSGVLFERARRLVEQAAPQPGVDETADAIAAALPLAAAAGITAIHNFEAAPSLRAFTSLRERGALTLRVFHGLARESLAAAAQLGLSGGFGDDWLRIGLVKLFADGALGSHTALLVEPYEGRDDGYRGLATLEREEIEASLVEAARAGLGVAVHAIGDAAVGAVLDAVESARGLEPAARQALYRIEHAQLVQPRDLARFGALRVVASVQPSHAVADWRAADALWGARCRTAYPWRSLADAGAPLAFGTDAPVESIDPLRTLHAATTRTEPGGQPAGGWYPEQRLRIHEALRAYTLGSAAAERADDRRGSLAAGKLADLVVLSCDPFEQEPAALLETQVEMTMVGGRVVYER